MCGPTGNEASANLIGGTKFPLSKRSSSRDRITRSTVCRRLGLE